MNFKQCSLIFLTTILILNFARGEEFIQPAYYYILTPPLSTNYNKIGPLSPTAEIYFVDSNQQQQQLYQQVVPNLQPKLAKNPELINVEHVKNMIEIPNERIEMQTPSSQIQKQTTGVEEANIIYEFTDANQTESSTDSGRIPISTNSSVKNNSKVVDLHKVNIRDTNDNDGTTKSKKSFDIVFSQEVLQQMARDLVNSFISKIPGGITNFNFTQYVQDVEKIIKAHLPYGILSVANGEVSNLVQNILPKLNGQPLQNLLNNPNLVNNNYANTNNGFDSWGTFFNYVLRNGGPGLTQPETGRNYNSLFMNNNGQPENRNYNPNMNYGQPENQNYNPQLMNNNGLPDSRNFNFPPMNNNQNFNSPPMNNNEPPQGRNFNPPPINNGQFDNRNYNPQFSNNGQPGNFNYPPIGFSGLSNNRNFNNPPVNNNGQNFNFPPSNNGQVDNRNLNIPSMNNNGQPGNRNFDFSSSVNSNGQNESQNSNFPFTKNNVQRRMVNNPNNALKWSDRNLKVHFT